MSMNRFGSYNTAIGTNTYIDASYSTAIGYNASTSNNNEIVLGTETETVYVPGQINATKITMKDTLNTTTITGNEIILQKAENSLSISVNTSGNIKINGNINNKEIITTELSIPIEINGTTYYIQLFNSG
jgi:hypothetical protein